MKTLGLLVGAVVGFGLAVGVAVLLFALWTTTGGRYAL